jgi:hypothetical protein
MLDRTEELKTWLEEDGGRLPTDSITLSTLRTFEAIFGQVWFGYNHQDNEDGVIYIESQISGLLIPNPFLG